MGKTKTIYNNNNNYYCIINLSVTWLYMSFYNAFSLSYKFYLQHYWFWHIYFLQGFLFGCCLWVFMVFTPNIFGQLPLLRRSLAFFTDGWLVDLQFDCCEVLLPLRIFWWDFKHHWFLFFFIHGVLLQQSMDGTRMIVVTTSTLDGIISHHHMVAMVYPIWLQPWFIRVPSVVPHY